MQDKNALSLKFARQQTKNRDLLSQNTVSFPTVSFPTNSDLRTSQSAVILGLSISLGAVGVIFPLDSQVALAVDLNTQHKAVRDMTTTAIDSISISSPSSINPFQPRSLFNALEKLKVKLFTAPIVAAQTLYPQESLINFSEVEAKNSNPTSLLFSNEIFSNEIFSNEIFSNELITAQKIENPDVILVDGESIVPSAESPQRFDRQSILNSPLSISNKATELFQLSDSSEVVPNLDKSDSLSTATTKSKVIKPEPLQVVEARQEKDDPYITKLRAEIEQLRDRYQNELKQERTNRLRSRQASKSIEGNSSEFTLPSSDLRSSPTTKINSAENSNDTNQKTSSEEVISITPIDDLEYNLVLKTATGETVTPELPPLSSPEEYLPTVSNGYSWPTKGTLTSGYGWRWGRLHKGIDIAAPIGTPIFAAASGEVISSGWHSGGYGNLIKMKHPDGSITLYAHNHRNLVRKGQKIRQGEQIAEMGNSGFSTGPHLHFEIRPNGDAAVNPMAFLGKK